MNEFKINDYEFRIKKMNAIEVLAIQSQIYFTSTKHSEQLFNEILERVEVRVDSTWLPVKEENVNSYLPAELETNPKLVKEIVEYFINDYIKPIFQKSNASN